MLKPRNKCEWIDDGAAMTIGDIRLRPTCLPTRRIYSWGQHVEECVGAVWYCGTYVRDSSGITGRLAWAGTFVSGVLTVIVVVPPGTVDVMRRVIVLVMSSSSLYMR
jgi:hypothetical protein